MVIPAWVKICEKPNEFTKIQVNPTKSDQIKPLFFIPTSNSQILASEQWGSLVPIIGWCRSSTVTLVKAVLKGFKPFKVLFFSQS